MTDPPQSAHDRVLWILANHGGKMDRSSLRRCTLMRYAFLDPILAELAREGRIKIDGELITLAGAFLCSGSS
jgi:hypothetical protein